MENRLGMAHTRTFRTELETREEQDGSSEKVIEGYFSVFNTETELWPGAFESIATGAFDGTISNDIRALINHDARLVLGRNKSGTLDLKVDSRGLWGSVKVNEKDVDAMNLYERVKRGDVDQCSFGFNILAEETEFRDDGSIKWIIKEIDLHEVSVVTFPAYEETGVQARHKNLKQMKQRMKEEKKLRLRERLENVKTTNATQKD